MLRAASVSRRFSEHVYITRSLRAAGKKRYTHPKPLGLGESTCNIRDRRSDCEKRGDVVPRGMTACEIKLMSFAFLRGPFTPPLSSHGLEPSGTRAFRVFFGNRR